MRKVKKTFIGKENPLKMRITKSIELKFHLNLETWKEHKALTATNKFKLCSIVIVWALASL